MKNLLALLFAISFIACGPVNTEDEIGDGTGIPDLDQSNWASECMANTSAYQGPPKMKNVVRFEAANIKLAQRLYVDADCREHYLTITRSSRYKYESLEKENGENKGLYNIDEQVNRFTVTPESFNAEMDLKNKRYCELGRERWTAGKATIVSNKNCDGNANAYRTRNRHNVIKYDISKSPETVTFGRLTSGQDGSTPSKRPNPNSLETFSYQRFD